MNKKTPQKNSEAARTRKAPAAHTLKIKVPIQAWPIVRAVASYLETTPEKLALQGLLSAVDCDLDNIASDARKIISKLREEGL